jgi:hypothetical protein
MFFTHFGDIEQVQYKTKMYDRYHWNKLYTSESFLCRLYELVISSTTHSSWFTCRCYIYIHLSHYSFGILQYLSSGPLISGAYEAYVKYRVRSPKFIWAPCVQLYSFAETPQLPPSPRIWVQIRGRYWSAKIDDIFL